MTKTQKILGSSILSILLLAVTFFSMCGIRMQRISDEEAAMVEGSEMQNSDPSDSTIEFVDEGSENASDLVGDAEADKTVDDGETFLSPEMVKSLQSELSDLETLFSMKQRTIDSLRHRAEEIKFGKVAKEGAEQTRKFLREDPVFASKSTTSLASAAETNVAAPNTAPPDLSAAPAAAEKFSEFRMYYQDALDAFYARRYDIAIQKFRKLMLRKDAGNLADNCQYWIGESYFALGDYYQAVVEFEKVAAWKGSNKIGDAQLMVAIALLKAGESDQARSEFSTLLSFFRDRQVTQKARRYIDMLERA